eukprot:COSAG01_NODE_44130_length_422_cov_0.941176_1_plen_41_part_10
MHGSCLLLPHSPQQTTKDPHSTQAHSTQAGHLRHRSAGLTP